MSVTIREVARQAGVSVATVSRVLNGSGPVSPATRARIEQVARQMRYVPNGAARSLTTSKTQTIGVLLPDLYGEFFSEVIRGIDRKVREHRYHILVSGSHEDPDEIAAALRAMSGRVDGLLVMSPALGIPALEANLPQRLPVVLLNGAVDVPELDVVMIDNEGGARAMTGHLLGLGHRRIALIKGPEQNHDAEERLRGYRLAMQEAGLSTEGLELTGDFTEEAGYRAALAIMAMPTPPTAVFAANDAMALGALSAFVEGGFRVPEDISIAGFDDIPMARYVSPPLTSVHVPISEMGARAVEVLLDALADGSHHQRVVETLSTRLMVRTSCVERYAPD